MKPLLAAKTNWEPQCATLAGYCYAVLHGMKVQLVTPYRVSHLQLNGVTVRGNVTSVYPRLETEIARKPTSNANRKTYVRAMRKTKGKTLRMCLGLYSVLKREPLYARANLSF